MTQTPNQPTNETNAQAAPVTPVAPEPVAPVAPVAPEVESASMDLFTEAAARQAQESAAAQQATQQHQETPVAPLPNTASEQVDHSAAAGSILGDQQAGQVATPPATPQSSPTAVPPTISQEEQAYLHSLGIDPASQQNAISGLLSRIREMAPYAQAGMQQLQQPPQPQQPVAPEPAPEEWSQEKYFQEKWALPEYRPEFDHAIKHGMVETDEATGLFKATPGYEAMAMPILNGLNEYHQRRAAQMQDLFAGNPFQKFHDVLAEPIKRDMRSEVERIVGERLQQIEDAKFFEQTRESNSDWMYATDQSGRQVESPAGRAFLDMADSLVNNGHSPRKAVEEALAYRQATIAALAANSGSTGSAATPPGPPSPEGGVAQPPSQPAPTAAAPAVAPQDPHPQPVTPEQISAAQQQSFLDSALSRTAHNANAVGGVPSQAPSDDADIDSMFTIAAAATAGQTPTVS